MIPRSDFEEAEKSGVVELGVFKWVSLRMMEGWRVGLNFINYSAVGFVSICILCVSTASLSLILWSKWFLFLYYCEFYQPFCCCWVCLNLDNLWKHSFTFFDFSGLNGSYFCIIVNFINHSAVVGFVSI